MTNFWDSNVWGFINLMAILLLCLLAANLLKKSFRFLRQSLIPTSVLAGIILLIVKIIYNAISGEATGIDFFNTDFFGGNGQSTLEIITYHCLALGFIASTLRSMNSKLTKKRSREIFDSGVTTVSGYLIQGVFGMAVTIIACKLIGFYAASGLLLPFGYGQGTGQALNFGSIYEAAGFTGGKSFGLTIAAMGFLSAAIGGVIHLNIMKKKGLYKFTDEEIVDAINHEDIQNPDEIPMNGSIDKMSIQVALCFISYLLAYLIISLLAVFLPGMKATLYGFNFLFGVLMALLIKFVMKLLRKNGIVKKQYINPFLMNRITGFCFDLMIVCGVAAIQMEFLKGSWGILLILGIFGAIITYFYVHYVSAKLFTEYPEEQFLAMYGMLTGTASTGMILLREVDPEYKGPAADNLVLQQLPAIVFGFPMMMLASLAPSKPVMVFFILIVFFVVMQLILFRSKIFRRK